MTNDKRLHEYRFHIGACAYVSKFTDDGPKDAIRQFNRMFTFADRPPYRLEQVRD